VAAGEIVTAPAPGNVLHDAVLALAPLGKSAMRRAAIEEDATAGFWPVTIELARATGESMSDDKIQINANERPQQTKPEAVDQQAQPSQASAAAQPNQRPAPGRRPLFRS